MIDYTQTEGKHIMSKFKGEIIDIQPTIEVGAKKFKKRTIVLLEDRDAKYPNEVPFVLMGDKTAIADQHRVGEIVELSYYLNGRRWDNPNTGKTQYFIEAKVDTIQTLQTAAPADAPAAAGDPVAAEPAADADNLPF